MARRVLGSLLGIVGLAFAATGAQAQQTQTFTYDVHGRLTAVTRTTGTSTQTTTYGLDDADNRTSRLLGAPTASAAMAAPGAGDPMAADAPAEPSEAEPAAENSDPSSDTVAEPGSDGPAA